MHTQDVFLGMLIKNVTEYDDTFQADACTFKNFEEASLDLIQKGLNAYSRFKSNPISGLDPSLFCLSEMGLNNQEFFLNSPIVKKAYPFANKLGVCYGLSFLYTLSSLPKDAPVTAQTVPFLPCLAPL